MLRCPPSCGPRLILCTVIYFSTHGFLPPTRPQELTTPDTKTFTPPYMHAACIRSWSAPLLVCPASQIGISPRFPNRNYSQSSQAGCLCRNSTMQSLSSLVCKGDATEMVLSARSDLVKLPDNKLQMSSSGSIVYSEAIFFNCSPHQTLHVGPEQ